jgi:DEAD/DEAH box helicase domain-containing protein
MKEFFEPNLYLYDAYPGGIGFSEPLYRVHGILLRKTQELISACPCEQGCPSCVGPAGEKCEKTKEVALAILAKLCETRLEESVVPERAESRAETRMMAEGGN